MALNWIYRIEPKGRKNRKKEQKKIEKKGNTIKNRELWSAYIYNEQRTIGRQIKKTETSFSWDIPKNNYYKSK